MNTVKYRKIQDSYKNTGKYRIYRTAGITVIMLLGCIQSSEKVPQNRTVLLSPNSHQTLQTSIKCPQWSRILYVKDIECHYKKLHCFCEATCVGQWDC